MFATLTCCPGILLKTPKQSFFDYTRISPGEGGGGGCHIKVTGLIVVPLRGQNSWFGTALRELKSKMASVSGMGVTFYFIEPKLSEEVKIFTSGRLSTELWCLLLLKVSVSVLLLK